ncbi:hypothetical protein F4703DRAFT_1608874 [Phycomyces blakesleeanus]
MLWLPFTYPDKGMIAYYNEGHSIYFIPFFFFYFNFNFIFYFYFIKKIYMYMKSFVVFILFLCLFKCC